MAWTRAGTDPVYGPWGWWQGEQVNQRTHDALLTAAKMVPEWHSLRVIQGGLADGAVEKSAATHDGLDVADLAIDGRPRSLVFELCTAIMKCGGVPFPRGYVDSFAEHIHVVMYAGEYAHGSAERQITSTTYGYAHGKNGLAGAPGPYYGPPQLPLTSWELSPHNPANQSLGVPLMANAEPIWINYNDDTPLKPDVPGYVKINADGDASVVVGESAGIECSAVVEFEGLLPGESASIFWRRVWKKTGADDKVQPPTYRARPAVQLDADTWSAMAWFGHKLPKADSGWTACLRLMYLTNSDTAKIVSRQFQGWKLT